MRVLASRTRWMIQQIDEAAAERLAEQCGIHPLVARLLLIRGCSTPEQVERFLQAGADTLHDPLLMDGMRQAVAAIREAIGKGRRIRIYGDYDADGISSTSLMIWLMRKLGAHYDYYIPHRVQEGYGLNKAALDRAKEEGVELIITVDTGISAAEEARYAAELGIDLIITDHHEPPERLPSAIAVINPKKPGCPYPFKQLAGVGVAFKLAQALLDRVPDELTELAALGTVADLMPLVDENRTLVRLGLRRMQRSSYVGLTALFHASGLEGKEISAGHIAFAIAPRINASGRLTSADAAVRLLTTEHEQEAALLAQELDELNRDRQRIVEETFEEAVRQLEARHGAELPPVIIASGEGWNAGVIGIVAARLLERYYRPTIVFTIDADTGMAKGSARSIRGYDIYRALTACADLMDHFGGHQAAAGMSLLADRLEELHERLNRLAREWLDEEDYIPLTEADLSLRIGECRVELIKQLELLAPYGLGNRSPRFLLERAAVKELRQIGKDGQHLKLQLLDRETGELLDAVGFGIGSLQPHIAPTSAVDVIGELQVNEWNGTRKAQLLIQDIRVSHLQVFDWRGLKPAASVQANEIRADAAQREPPRAAGKTAAGLLSGSDRPVGRTYPGLRDEAEFVICDELPYWRDTIRAMFGERRIWLLDADGLLSPADPRPETEPPRDLVLVQLPPGEHALKRMLADHGDRLERVCVWFADADECAAGCPSRDQFKHIYCCLKQCRNWSTDDPGFLRGLSARTGVGVNDVAFILRVFEELGFVARSGAQGEFVPNPAPRNLESSPRFRRRSEGQKLAEHYLLMSTAQLARHIAELARSGHRRAHTA